MTASVPSVRRWFVPGDLNGFFGLVVDNLSILGFIAAALIGIFQFPAEVVFTRMFPGTALGVLVGNLIYTWMAHRLAAKTGRGRKGEKAFLPKLEASQLKSFDANSFTQACSSIGGGMEGASLDHAQLNAIGE